MPRWWPAPMDLPEDETISARLHIDDPWDIGVAMTAAFVVFAILAFSDKPAQNLQAVVDPVAVALIGGGTILFLGLVIVLGRRSMWVRTQRKRLEVLGYDLAELQRLSGLGYWQLTPDGGIYWSPELYSIFGFDEPPEDIEEAYGRIHPDDQKRARAQIEHLWKQGGSITDEERIRWPDGTTRWLAYRCHAETDDDGNVVRLFGTTRDITQRKQDEAVARRFLDLLNRLDDVYFIADLVHDGFTFSNSAAKLLGHSPDTLANDPDLFRKALADGEGPFMDGLSQALTDGASQAEFTIHPPDRPKRVIRLHAWADPHGGPATAFGIMRDITDAKELDRAQEEMERLKDLEEMKALFMNAAAHELNTPITPLKIQTAILERADPDGAGVQLLKRNVLRLEALVRDLLDASRVQSGRLKYAMEENLDLRSILEDIGSTGALQAKEADVTWEMEVPERPLLVRGDPLRLTQVVSNLVNNAIKFTPAGGHVELTAERQADAVQIRITDTGHGLTTEQITGLFEPFRQFHGNKTGVHKGTGLGLFIAKGIVEQHDGQIHVESPGAGAGATFHVMLPSGEGRGDALASASIGPVKA